MHLQLGEIPTVVISSRETAKEVLKTHDWVFCNRPKLLMAQVVYKNYSDIALSPYSEYWREVRKIATLELFTARRILEFRPFREEATMDFIKSLLIQDKEGSVIDLTTELFSLSFDITLRYIYILILPLFLLYYTCSCVPFINTPLVRCVQIRFDNLIFIQS